MWYSKRDRTKLPQEPIQGPPQGAGVVWQLVVVTSDRRECVKAQVYFASKHPDQLIWVDRVGRQWMIYLGRIR